MLAPPPERCSSAPPPARLPLPALATHFWRMSQDQVACPGSWPHWLQLTGVVPLFCRKKQLSLKKKRDPLRAGLRRVPMQHYCSKPGLYANPTCPASLVSISPSQSSSKAVKVSRNTFVQGTWLFPPKALQILPTGLRVQTILDRPSRAP